MKYLALLLFVPTLTFAKTYTCNVQEVYLNDFTLVQYKDCK